MLDEHLRRHAYGGCRRVAALDDVLGDSANLYGEFHADSKRLYIFCNERMRPIAMRRLLILALALLAPLIAAAQQTGSFYANPLGGNITAADAGTCSTVNTFLWQHLPANASTTTVNLAGTFSGTVTVRMSNNGGGSWATQGTQTSAGTSTYPANGFTDVCADVTTFTSGNFNVTISTGLNTGPQGPPGPAGTSTGGITLATAAPSQVITVSNNCASQIGTCYPVANTGRYDWQATLTNNS